MKHEIKVGDQVVYLYCQFLMKGTCVKVNKKSIKVQSPADGVHREIVKLVKPERVAHIDDRFTMVFETDRGAEGAYRIDYETYPDKNAPWTNWRQPYTYVTERQK